MQGQLELDDVVEFHIENREKGSETHDVSKRPQANRDSLTRQLIEDRKRLSQIDQQLFTLAADAAPTGSQGFLRDVL